MTRVFNCGEQEIEDNGVSISLTFQHEENDTPREVFINTVDNLLGISEFITDCEYNYAEVGIDYTPDKVSKDYLSLLTFLNKEENKGLKDILTKYVKFYEEDPLVEDGTIWYNFMVEARGTEMSEEDLIKFKDIFKGVVQ